MPKKSNNTKVLAVIFVIITTITASSIYNITKLIKANRYYEEATAFINEGNYTQAYEKLTLTENTKSNYKNTADLTNTVNTTLESIKKASEASENGKYSNAINALKSISDCNEKKKLVTVIEKNLKQSVYDDINSKDFYIASELIKKEYSSYKSVTGLNIEEIDAAEVSLTKSAVDYAQDMLNNGDYGSLKNAIEQLRKIDPQNTALPNLTDSYNNYISNLIQQANEAFAGGKGDIETAISKIDQVLAIETDNSEAKKLSDTFNTYKNVVAEVKKAETAYNNGNYETALSTIENAFSNSEIAKNNYNELYIKIYTARQNEIEEAKRAEEAAKRAEEEAKRVEEEAKLAAEREAAKNKKVQIRDCAFSNMEAWQKMYNGYNHKNEYYEYYDKYFAFDIENTGTNTVFLNDEHDFYFVFGSGEYKDAQGGIYKYDVLVNNNLLHETDSRLKPGEKRRCVIKVHSDSVYNGDKVYYKNELLTTIN